MIRIRSIGSRAMPSRFSAGSEEAPQSIKKLTAAPVTWKQVLSRPPEPNASPQPTNCSCIGCRASVVVEDYRPRGVPNTRISSQTGITMTAPSRK